MTYSNFDTPRHACGFNGYLLLVVDAYNVCAVLCTLYITAQTEA
jgi:hypothetical protein